MQILTFSQSQSQFVAHLLGTFECVEPQALPIPRWERKSTRFRAVCLLQLFDRSGMLYGELARFVLRMLGVRGHPKLLPNAPNMQQLAGPQRPTNHFLEGPKEAGGGWDNVWSGDGTSMSG
jgi:hypothetical protein